MAKSLIGACMVMVLGGFGSCMDEPGPDEIALTRSGGVEIIGISGRRLEDGDRYRVPLDSPRAVAIGARVREAMVVVNRGLDPVHVERIELTPAAGSTGPWRLLAPTRARELWLDVAGTTLAPDDRIDFDVGLTAEVEGPQRASLTIAWRQRDRPHLVRIAIEAWAAGASASTGPDPP